jgi:site-specific DNA-methyltransferase (adenine-specific)
MTQGEDPKQSLSVENVLLRKRNVKGKAINISAKNAQEIINQNPSEELLNKLREGKIKIDKAHRQIKNLQKRQGLLSNLCLNTIQFPDNIRIIEGNFIEKCMDIPDNSIDLIFTDPPYNRGWLPFYEPLGKIAFRVLKEGGSLVMYAGHYALPQIFDYMRNSGLHYRWEIMVKHPGSSARMFDKNVIVTYKPLLWFVNGNKPKILEFIKDSIESKRPDKTLSLWTQSTDEAVHVISKLTVPNDVVLDPLMGTGNWYNWDSCHKAKQCWNREECRHTSCCKTQNISSRFLGANTTR